jgi:hypothetical protein
MRIQIPEVDKRCALRLMGLFMFYEVHLLNVAVRRAGRRLMFTGFFLQEVGGGGGMEQPCSVFLVLDSSKGTELSCCINMVTALCSVCLRKLEEFSKVCVI